MESSINICWKHSLKTDKVRTAIERVTANLGTDYGAKTTWAGSVAHFRCESGSAKGITGCIEVRPRLVRLRIELPLLIRPFAQKIREGVQGRLLEHLGGGVC